MVYRGRSGAGPEKKGEDVFPYPPALSHPYVGPIHGVFKDQAIEVKQVGGVGGLFPPITRRERRKGLSSCDLVLPRLNCVSCREYKRQLGPARAALGEAIAWVLEKTYTSTDVLFV